MPDKSNKKTIEHTVRNLSEQPVKNAGFELWSVGFYKEAGEYILELVIDKPDSLISLADCEKITRLIGPLLDAADPIEQSYSLVVASPGINRELKTDEHIIKYLGKPVTARLFAGRRDLDKTFEAVLKSYENGSFEFETEPGKNIIKTEKKEVARLCARDSIKITNGTGDNNL
ncbi:MAG: ribosome maturation factor RimP [Oscillospiraceae bacterium]|nr:ribosome maturation factor RimP [Oscillospiraceae bacterium]